MTSNIALAVHVQVVTHAWSMVVAVSLPSGDELPEGQDSAEQGIMSISETWMISLVKIVFTGLQFSLKMRPVSRT